LLRTCIGCRRRDDRSALLRVVAVAQGPDELIVLAPDTRRRLPGRGAWLHPATACLDRAVQRRAFARALRVKVRIDVGPLTRWVESHEQSV
jgi:uncharacterized protein